MKYPVIAISALFFSACAIVGVSYKEPASGPVARIVFLNNGVGDGSAELFEGYETCKGRQTSQIIKPGDSLELKVAANEPLSFSLGYNVYGDVSAGYAYCRVYATFEPNESSKYIAKISSAKSGCVLDVEVQTEVGELKPIEGLEYRKPTKSQLYEGSSFCQ